MSTYDDVPYPTAIFSQTHPDRLATLARLAGLDPPAIETARVLEIGAGDGMNLIALAIAFPEAQFVGFDLAPTAIERGLKWIATTGVRNVRLEVLDILDAADVLDGAFDYIIAHGVYAWVPDEVRAATMALIGRKLSADGVAFVSYNALPGGYLRLALRDALQFALDGIESAAERVSQARAHLAVLAEKPESAENPLQAALRDAASRTLDKPWSVLCHDELGPYFYPQSLADVVAAANANGLRFLGDADRELMANAFLPDDVTPEDDPDRQLVRLLQATDYRETRFFRQTLLVSDQAQPRRRIDQGALAALFATTRCRRIDATHFREGVVEFEMCDEVLAEALGRLTEARPRRIRVRDLVDDETRRLAIFELFDAGLLDLHTVDFGYVDRVSDRPVASPLVRAMIADGMSTVCTLDHRLMAISEFGPRHLLASLDGSRTVETLADVGAEAGLDTPEALSRGLQSLVCQAVLVA